MQVRATTDSPPSTGADTIAVGVFEDEDVAHDTPDGALGALLESGEAQRGFKKLALTRSGGARWIVVGLGSRDAFDAERARAAAAVALGRAQEIGARVLCWELPHRVGDDVASAFVEGTLMADYRYDAWKSDGGSGDDAADARRVGELVVSAHHDIGVAVERGRVIAEAANAARDLQNAPANDVTPTRLAERARALADELDTLECEVLGREQIRAAGMGAFAGVAQGSEEEPALITLRYTPAAGAAGPVLGFVGKAVTFDSGGISIKPGMKMSDMKFDMSGGAAVLEAVGAVARLGLPVRVVAVVGATENLPSGRALKPGDIIRARTGKTIEIINTDAEGRLVLADCLAHARDCGAERLVDLATLTGAIITTFGSVYAGVFSNDDAWCEAVVAAGDRAGERAWRLPLDPDYSKMIEGRYGDILNAVEDRKAASITAAEFLSHFAGDVPWAHLDIAGVSWDTGREYAKKGGTGFGVRLLVALAEASAA